MKKYAIKQSIGILLVLASLFGFVLSSYADDPYGFYMDCDASVVNDQADGFMIDFYSDSAEALCTYWSKANWSMDTAFSSKILGATLSGGGAYAGVQIKDTPSDRAGIMSLWRYEYRCGGKTEYIYAKALYGKTTTDDNEGLGTSCVMPYAWKSGTWYRQLLLCWQDAETGNTLIGTWFYDYDADKWTLFAYYNTFLYRSFIKGGVGQFLENFSESQGARYRSFCYRNVYFLSHESGQWVSSPKVSLRSVRNSKVFGEAKLGVSEDGTYVWASADGTSSVDTDHTLSVNPTLVQSEKPIVSEPKIDLFTVHKNGSVYWCMAENSTPQLSYALTIEDANGNVLRRRSATRPDTIRLALGDLETDTYKCTLTVTDVFGKSTEATYCSDAYTALFQEQAPSVNQENPPSASENEMTWAWIGFCAAATVAIALALTAWPLKKKKKRG